MTGQQPPCRHDVPLIVHWQYSWPLNQHEHVVPLQSVSQVLKFESVHWLMQLSVPPVVVATEDPPPEQDIGPGGFGTLVH
jgi:hypothetical protein